MNFNPPTLLEDNTTTLTLQKGGIWYGWFDTEETSCTNASITFLNVNDIKLHTEGNACGIISLLIIGSTFRLVPAQDVPYALILWYVSKIIYLS